MKIFIKRFSILFLAIMVSTNLVFNTKREAKAIAPVLVAPIVAEGLTTISLALLMYADYKFTDNTKAYAKAKELDQKLIDMGVTLKDGVLNVTQDVYNAISDVIATTKTNLINNLTVRNEYTSGMYNTSFSVPVQTGYVARDTFMLNASGDLSGTFKINFEVNQNSNTTKLTRDLPFTTPTGTTSIRFKTETRNEVGYAVVMQYLVEMFNSSGARVGSTSTFYNLGSIIGVAPFTYTGSVSIGALTGYKDNSISLDYTPDVESADTEKAKVALPIGSSISAIPNAWSAPLSGDLSIPVPTVGDIATVNVGEVPTTGDVAIDIPGTIGAIEDKFDKPNFDKTWKIIKDMDTSRGAPPKITFDLSKLYSAATLRFGAPKNPFESKEYTLIDFAMLQSYQFGGLPLIDYFRGIVGMGFIITTFMYVWRKITPNNVIGG